MPCLLNSGSGSINCTLGAQSSSGQSLSSEFEEADSVVDYGGVPLIPFLALNSILHLCQGIMLTIITLMLVD